MTKLTRTPNLSTLEQARAALRETQGQLDQLDAQHRSLSVSLGDALARVRLGDKRAEANASTSSMRRAGVDGERDRLRLEISALHARIETLEQEAAKDAAAAAVSNFDHLTERARALEFALAEQMRVAAATAAELQRMGPAWDEARRVIALAGHDVENAVAPRNPASIFQSRVIEDADQHIEFWLAPPRNTLHQTPARLSQFPYKPEGAVIVLDRDLASDFVQREPA